VSKNKDVYNAHIPRIYFYGYERVKK